MQQLVIQLDDDRQRRLNELCKERGAPTSVVLGDLIDDAYEQVMQKRRIRAAERLIGLCVENPPDPATLSRELEAAHEPGGLPPY